MNTEERVNQLFDQYIHRRISATELEELIAWVQGIPNSDIKILSEPMQELWRKAKAGALFSTAGEVNWEQVYTNVTTSEPGRVILLRKKWVRIAAAAAVIIGIGFAGFFWFNNQREPSVIAKEKPVLPEQILPGKDRAVLLLANGDEIILDSSVNGQLAVQGSTRVINKDGKIIYNSGAAAQQVLYNTLSTARGNQYQLILPDGSKVWLNAASSITYPTVFIKNEREVSITGEAYFEIAKDARKPFRVTVKDMTVEVLGTHFNINSYTNESAITTTLLEGAVKVTSGNQQVILQPGKQAQLNKLQLSASIANTDMAVAWVRGYFQFEKADVKTILRQVSRWYDLEIVYEGTVPNRAFSGKLERSLPLSGVLRLFDAANLRFRIEGKKMIVTS